MESEGDGPRTAFDVGETPDAAAVTQEEYRETQLRSSSAERAGERVAEALQELRLHGYQVSRDSDTGDDGTVAHLVSGSTGVFLVEARRGRYENKHLEEARRRAEELFHELDTWVTPVICLAGRSWRGPRREEKVWIVRRSQIAKWISGRRNPVLGSEHLPDITAER